MTERDTRVGTPITTAQACRAILRMIDSPIIGDVDLDGSPGYTIQRIKDRAYDSLSSGERRLVDVAESLWVAPFEAGARISVLGGLDRTNRRKVLIVLWYLFMGRDLDIDLDEAHFIDLFEDRPGKRQVEKAGDL